MSNRKTPRVQFKIDIPLDVKETLQTASNNTGFSMVQIICMLVRNYCSTLDVEHDMRRVLAKVASRNKEQLKLTPKQKRVIKNDILNEQFTNDLL